LIDPNPERAVELAGEAVSAFAPRYHEHWLAGMREKLGLLGGADGDLDLVRDLLQAMQENAAITQLDFTGPFEVLSRLATPPSLTEPSAFAQSGTHVVAKSMQPVFSDRGLGILPTCAFESCPQLDLICVPGGAGVVAAIADDETVEFVRRQSAGAQYVTSVCTGAFLLGAAGLLKGRRAATHWAYVDLLPLVGATHENGRIVRDGNLFTAGGVTSGIDFAFCIVAEVAGPQVAQAIQLAIEYDPSPPFDAGHPDKASEAAVELMVRRNETARKGLQQLLSEARSVGAQSLISAAARNTSGVPSAPRSTTASGGPRTLP